MRGLKSSILRSWRTQKFGFESIFKWKYKSRANGKFQKRKHLFNRFSNIVWSPAERAAPDAEKSAIFGKNNWVNTWKSQQSEAVEIGLENFFWTWIVVRLRVVCKTEVMLLGSLAHLGLNFSRFRSVQFAYPADNVTFIMTTNFPPQLIKLITAAISSTNLS